MPNLATLVLFFGAALLLAAMPGPGLFYIAGRTLASGRGDGLASCMGSAVGGCMHVLAGALGISALLMASATAFNIIKLAGGIYLIYLGIQAWRSASVVNFKQGVSVRADVLRACRQGIIVEATNPKTAAFFLALIPQFIDVNRGDVALQFIVLGSMSVALNTGMAVLVVAMSSILRSRLTDQIHLVRRLRRGSGVALGGLGVSLLLSRRSV